VDTSILIGSYGWYFMWFLLFIKNKPVVAIAEVK
jgi:molybdopterin-containing oxidoreductase family membrane subunit